VKVFVTGGAGFIGSTFVRWVLREQDDVQVTTSDALTYAGNLANLAEIEGPRHTFVPGDATDPDDHPLSCEFTPILTEDGDPQWDSGSNSTYALSTRRPPQSRRTGRSSTVRKRTSASTSAPSTPSRCTRVLTVRGASGSSKA
jgi:hypothetical protein